MELGENRCAFLAASRLWPDTAAQTLVRPGVAAAIGEWAHGQASGARVWTVATIHGRLVEPGRLDDEYRYRRSRQSVQPLLHGPVGRMVSWHDIFAAVLRRRGRESAGAHAPPGTVMGNPELFHVEQLSTVTVLRLISSDGTNRLT